MGTVACAVAGVLITATPAAADQEAPNIPYVATDSEFGRCYAHSVPEGYYGTAGATRVYNVAEEAELVSEFDWYAPQMRIACNISDGKGVIAPALAQIGPWPRGHTPDEETLAIAFYYDGALRARYSTLDIADNNRENASCSVSHYSVIAEIEGYVRRSDAYGSIFRLTTVDGRRLTFSAVSGALMEKKSAKRWILAAACCLSRSLRR